MELNKIEELLEKYFEGNSNEKEEQILKMYFAKGNVAEHLKSYKSLFGSFAEAKQVKSSKNFTLNSSQKRRKSRRLAISIAASLIVAIGTGVFMFSNYPSSSKDDLGTYDDPKVALIETQKALKLLSKHVNTGYKSVEYIDQFEITKNKIFNLNY